MKPIAIFLSLSLFITFSSCNEQATMQPIPEGEQSFYITGISQSLTYSFNSGRLSETPDDVRELNILVMDNGGEIVYEQWYYNYNYYNYQDTSLVNGDVYYYENTIPDTLFIPALPVGNYDIIAATTYLNYYSDPIYNPDGTVTQGSVIYPRIEPYTVSESPIYVGKSNVMLAEDNQEVVLNMRNISARVTLEKEAGTANVEDGHLELIFKTRNNKYFSFEEDALLDFDYDYDYYVYTYLFNENKKHFYVLPMTSSSATIAYYHNQMEMYNFSIEVPFDPFINLQTNDAISFSINLDALLDGANSGIVLWDDITWNDLGEVSIP